MTATLHIKKDRPNYYILIRYKDEVGKKRQKCVSTSIPVKGNNKRKADEKLLEVLTELKNQQLDLSKDVLFTDFYGVWIESLKHSLAPTTYDGYNLIFKAHILPYFGVKALKVKDLTPAHIQQYVNCKIKTLSPNTVIKHLRNISKCLDSAVKQSIIAVNPVKRIDMPKKVKFTGAKYYNENEIERLLNCSKGDPLEIAILLTVFYGLRRSEVLGIKWDSIDFAKNTLSIKHTVTQYLGKINKLDATKNESSCTVIPLSEFIKAELLKWKEKQAGYSLLQPNNYIDEGYICTQADGKLMSPNYVSNHFSLLLAKHNLPPIRFHDLRHSSASYLKYLGFDLKDIQIWLRHKDIQTTLNIYTHLDMTAKTEIANRLNDRFVKFN